MVIVERKPVPIYEVVCPECGSILEYTASEVSICHITCPVCNVSVWADTTNPVKLLET